MGKLRFVSGKNSLTTLKGLAGNIFWLRLAAFALSLCLVPAFMLGVVSVWSVLFAVIIGLRFRAGLIRINEDIDRTENYSGIKYRLWFVALCLESMTYMAITQVVFYEVYVKGLWPWPIFAGSRFDEVIGFFNWIPAISFSDVASPYQKPALYIVSTASMLAHIVLVSLLAIAGRCVFGLRVGTIFPLLKKNSPYAAMRDHLYGIYASFIMVIILVIVEYTISHLGNVFMNASKELSFNFWGWPR